MLLCVQGSGNRHSALLPLFLSDQCITLVAGLLHMNMDEMDFFFFLVL